MRQNEIDSLVKSGMSVIDATNQVNNTSGVAGGGAGGTSGSTGTTKAGTPEQVAARQSAFDILRGQFAQYGLEALVDPLQNLIQENVSPAEFAIRLRQTEPYKK